ncbi:MAG: heme-dependent oxidative N-demethylase subunit alpha family protein [Verrucomicrobiales bacterium]
MPSPTDPIRSLTDGSFRFQMALRPGEGAPFFAPTPLHGEVMGERRSLLRSRPDLYAASLPGCAHLLNATATLIARWLVQAQAPAGTLPPAEPDSNPAALHQWCADAGCVWEPDWVILQPDRDAAYRLVAGAVCFPSGWALTEKLGQPLDTIHQPVPGLNQSLGRPIHVFLARLQPGAVWWRDNWGLAADSALNHHPSLHLRSLTDDTPLTAVWLRYEEQLLTLIPESSSILFGIRVGRVRLSQILPFPEVTRRLIEALRSMPEDVAIYKGIAFARTSLLRQLESVIR